ncbi:MAG: ATP-binding protein [Pseudomonadota bacterium]
MTPDPILGTQSGMFLAAPRRTGKSTFLRRELVPHLEEAGTFTIYVDLWSDRDADPGRLIADVIARALDRSATMSDRIASFMIPTRVSVGGVSVELTKGEANRTGTLTDALVLIGEKSGKDVALIIDEAQHALSTKAGIDAIFALKAARDEMNQREKGARLYLVFTGSHRDKLAGFVQSHRDPFFGAYVSDFPKLGRPFIDSLVAAMNERLADDNQLDTDDVETAFELVGYQPEALTALIQQHALGEEGSAGLKTTVSERANRLRALRWDQHASDFGDLNDLQREVLRVLAGDGAEFAPFTEDTLIRVSEALGRRVETNDVQRALDALREKSLVWRPSRGIYALEDQDMREWLLADQPG